MIIITWSVLACLSHFKWILQKVRSNASCFCFQYLLVSLTLSNGCLRLLSRLFVTSIIPWTTRFWSNFPRRLCLIHLAFFVLLQAGYLFLLWLYVHRIYNIIQGCCAVWYDTIVVTSQKTLMPLSLRYSNIWICQSRWPCGLRRRSEAFWLLALRVWNPPGTWIFASCVSCS